MSQTLDELISRLGKPDFEDSTENDVPQPPILTRWIIYRKANVRMTFVPEAKPGQAPPCKTWTLRAVQDHKTDAPITIPEANRRFREAGMIR